MSAKRLSLIAGALALVLWSRRVARPGPAPAALAGTVSSAKEGLMEGVVVSAKKAGSTVTISVATDDKGRFSFPASEAGAGPVRAQHPRDRLRPRRPQERRGRGRTDGERRDQARPDEESAQADVQCRMVRELSRDRPGEQGHPQLRELSQPRPHRAFAIRRRAVHGRVQPDGRLLPRQHAGASAAACRQRATLARPGRRREGDRGISLPDQSEPRDLALSAQDAAAPDRPLQPLHRHRIRPAAPADPAARCHRRRSGHRSGSPISPSSSSARSIPRPARYSEFPDSRAQAGLSGRHARSQGSTRPAISGSA